MGYLGSVVVCCFGIMPLRVCFVVVLLGCLGSALLLVGGLVVFCLEIGCVCAFLFGFGCIGWWANTRVVLGCVLLYWLCVASL